MRARTLLLCFAILPACAEGSSGVGGGGGGVGAGGGAGPGAGGAATTSSSTVTTSSSASGGGAGGGATVASCPPGEFMTGLDADGAPRCADLAALTKAAFEDHCRVHLGARDNCGSCNNVPEKWGWASPKQCANGLGVDNTCQSVSLGGSTVRLFGLNFDGDVDDNDKLYGRLGCDEVPLDAGPGPCAAGELVVGGAPGALECGAAAAGILDALGSHCSLTLGQRDSCDGCDDPPTVWGRASTAGCEVGSAGGNTCTPATLGGELMTLIGLDLAGQVDGNDKLYAGIGCTAPTPTPASGVEVCPPGQYATGISSTGLFDCAALDAVAIAHFESQCSLYLGWTDSCNGCTTPPTKWGKVSAASCTDGAGADGSCIEATLGASTTRLYGLSFDGDVGGDDTVYVGLRCD